MNILTSTGWPDYELLDSGNGMRFERFGPYTTVRPDPQAIWKPFLPQSEWQKADVLFQRTRDDKGVWKFKRAIPEKWKMEYKNISFWTRLTSFKHTGVFPEQSLQWDFITEKISSRLRSNKTIGVTRDGEPQKVSAVNKEHDALFGADERQDSRSVSVLNLFGYTGIASIVAAAAGAKVTHVDASKPSITWARENQKLSRLEEKPIRWILDDAVKFVEREIRRGTTYDGVIMDPPVYGHGPTGQVWKFNENFPRLMESVSKLLSPNPLFVVVNAYAISASSLMLQNVMDDYLKHLKGTIEVGELILEEKFGKRPLSTGIFARWSK
ncbi:MAG TPA: class I SAM-dependent methyltransferase [Candidatus Saccharimonadales bacterium]|nr:class I SAM-dependent methyltransferase [Candidatus Saccharimonadales bacterium]